MATNNEAKQKIRDKVASGFKSDEIEVIEAKKIENIYDSKSTLRVAAYCRVSTDNIEQTTSYELQKQHYMEYISQQKNWVLVDIYADEGISATSMKHRDNFNRMIRDCELGKIDLILVKSVARFARNLVDCVGTIRKLKSLSNPVRIIFESENIDTAKSDFDMFLQLMAMLAEMESRNKSDIMIWSLAQRFRKGLFLTPRLFGYNIDKDEPSHYVINEEEAKVVELVYSMFITGYSYNEIAEICQNLGLISNVKGECKWNACVVENMISNERRSGQLVAWMLMSIEKQPILIMID